MGMMIHLLCTQFTEMLMAQRIFFMICSRVSSEKYRVFLNSKTAPIRQIHSLSYFRSDRFKSSHVLKTGRNCTLGARNVTHKGFLWIKRVSLVDIFKRLDEFPKCARYLRASYCLKIHNLHF